MSPKAATQKRPSKRPDAPPEGARERILQTAHDLIYREGARAVGIDRIVAESGVAKMSLYRWFPSKDALIAAVLEERERNVWMIWNQNMERHKNSPLKQLRAQFESLSQVIAHPSTRGCAFLNVAVELADESHPAREIVRRHKTDLLNKVAELTAAAGAKQPKVLAEQLMLVADGAHASSQVLGKAGPTTQLLSIVDALLATHIPSKR